MDLIDELRLRRWARTHHVPAAERPTDWDPVVLDEMRRKDAECDGRGGSMPATSPQPAVRQFALEDASVDPAPESRTVSERAACAPAASTRHGYVPLVPDSRLVHVAHPAHTRLADPNLLKQIERITAESEMAGARQSDETATAW